MTPEELSVTDARGAADALAMPPTGTEEAARVADAVATPPTATAEAVPAPLQDPPPRLADGVELIGEFADSGFRQAPFIARRSDDGQVVQMPEMLYRLAEQIGGQSGYDELADRFSHAIQRHVTPADVRMLVERQLRPLGIVAPDPGDEPTQLRKVDPLLALKFRAAIIPDGPVRSLTTIFRPLFAPPVMVLAVLAMVGLDGWLFFVHGVSQSLRHTLHQPALMLLLIGGVILATAFHEIGHATACRTGGAKPGVMGVGIYIVWPAFYTDITDAYRLRKWGRLRTDIGGMYFNALFALATAAIYAATSFEPLLLLIVLQNFAIMQQALPLLRLDGYYILADLTGVPDIFMRIRPILSSFLPRRPADARVRELKPWVRAVVSAYVLLIVVFLTLTGLALVINLPRMLATGYNSAAAHFSAVGPAFSHGHAVQGILDASQGMFLILPALGLVYTAARVIHRSISGGLKWSAGHPARRATLGLAGTAFIVLAALSWWPNGEYRPIAPGERGTVSGLFGQIAQLPTARPSLTPQRQQQLGLGSAHGAPTASGSAGSPSGAAHGGTVTGARLTIKKRSTPTATSAGLTSTTSAGGRALGQPAPAQPAPGASSAGETATAGQTSTVPSSTQAGPTAPAPVVQTTTTATSSQSSTTSTAPAPAGGATPAPAGASSPAPAADTTSTTP
jgi:putative peptide zinc metalloprotease protein